jgi:ATP-dependent helicase/nuclease subunit B
MCGDAVSSYAEVLSFQRLCHRVLSIAGGLGEIALDAGGKIITLQKVISEVAPELTVYRRPSQKTAFLNQMMELFDELCSYQIAPEMLGERIEELQGPTKEKLKDLSLIYASYTARLKASGIKDPMTMLGEKLKESGYVSGKDIFIDGFSYFTAQEYRVLEIMLQEARSVTVVLLGEENSKTDVFEMSTKTKERLQRLAIAHGYKCRVVDLNQATPCGSLTALEHLERYFFGETLPYEGPAGMIQLCASENVFSEVKRNKAMFGIAKAGEVKGRGFDLMNDFLECMKKDFYSDQSSPFF